MAATKKSIDYTGRKIGKLFVFRRKDNINRKIVYWICQCECGKTVELPSTVFRSAHKSCGCNIKPAITNLIHGMSKTRIYTIWHLMNERCYNKKSISYPRYGGKGISVCKRWWEFIPFYEDMKRGYRDDLTLDRKNNKKNYCKSNCRWATSRQQAQNRTNNVILIINGESNCIGEWARISGTNPSIIRKRYLDGRSHRECVWGIDYENRKDKPKRVVDMQTGRIYLSYKEAADKTNLRVGLIQLHLSPKGRKRGYTRFKYENELSACS